MTTKTSVQKVTFLNIADKKGIERKKCKSAMNGNQK